MRILFSGIPNIGLVGTSIPTVISTAYDSSVDPVGYFLVLSYSLGKGKGVFLLHHSLFFHLSLTLEQLIFLAPFFLVRLGLNSGLRVYKAGALLLEPHL
jgi:hypothetical protein